MHATKAEKIYSFADFEIDAAKRLLLKNGSAVTLNPKAFELLLALVRKHGEVLSKDELLETVWAGQFVEENNLTVHVAALRKILGEKKKEHRFIVTIPGKGYSFVAKVETLQTGADIPEINKLSGVQAEKNFAAPLNGQDALRVMPRDDFDADDALIGRGREIADIKNMLRREGARLITLTGAGGTGKTTLAKAAAEELKADFPDGVFFIELAAVNNADFLASAIAQALDVKESGEKSPVDSLKLFLAERRMMLVLDNFEQLASAAPLLQEFAAAAAFLKILVTSRVKLKLGIEQEFIVTPLACPPREAKLSADELSKFSAVALFIRRARDAKRNFTLNAENAPVVAEICHRLDGLPLAIELAAARIRLLSVQSIFERLENSLKLLAGGANNLPERQRTIRGTIQWSYELLDENEKLLFRRLAIFAGGFGIEAAEAVCENYELRITNYELFENGSKVEKPAPEIEVIDAAASLLDNNLLSHKDRTDGSVRLRMPEVVREFALESLAASGELYKLRQNHARFFLALAEEAEPHLSGERAGEWLEKLEIEHDNLRAALEWSLDSDAETGARLAAALRFLWINHSHLTEGVEWLKAAFEKSHEAPIAARFKLLLGLGALKRIQGDYKAAREFYEKGLEEGRAAGDRRQIARASSGLGTVFQLQGKPDAAQKCYEEGLTVSREIEDDFAVASALNCLGALALMNNEYAEARLISEEALTVSRELGNKEIVTRSLNNLGTIALAEADEKGAYTYFTEGLRIALELGHKIDITDALNGLAALAARQKDLRRAAQLAGAAENLRESIGYTREPAERRFCDTYLEKAGAESNEKAFDAAFTEGKALDLAEVVALAEYPPSNGNLPASSFDANEQITEIIIENRSFSRIIVEEEIEEPGHLSNGNNGFSAKSKALAGEIIDVSPASGKADSTGGRRKKYHLAAIAAGLILVLMGGIYLWQRQANLPPGATFAGSTVKQLTSVGSVSIAALSPDGKLFAYVKNDVGQRSLWLGYVDGGNHLLLRPAEEASYHKLAFSHDSSHLYFSLRDGKNPKSALYKMPVFGGAQQKILDEITNFALSPDGSRVALARRSDEKGKDSLIVMKLDGSEKSEAASFSKPLSLIFDSVSWSSDGNRLALSVSRDDRNFQQEIAVVEISSGETKLIAESVFREVTNTAWLADSSGLIVTAMAGNSWSSVPQYRIFHVAYPGGETSEITTDRSGYGTSLGLSGASDLLLTIEHRQMNNIWITPADDLSAARQITFGSFGRYDGLWGMDFTPEGKLIYTNSDTRSQFISAMNTDGGEAKPLTAPGVVDSVLMVSADGRYVVFHSNRGSGFDIWRMDIDGANLKQMTFGGKGVQPFVSADSRWIYYKSWLGDVGELRRVSIDGGEPEILSANETSWGSFSPDGKFFAASYITDKQRLAVFSAETNELVRQFDLPKTGTLYMGSRWTPDSRAVVYRDNAYGYWMQPVEGGEPRRLEGLPKEKLYNFAFSKDGKWFAFVRGQEIRDVVLFENAVR